MKLGMSIIFILISLILCEGHCSVEKDILDDVLESCEKYQKTDYLYQYCQAYLAPKEEIQKQGDQIVKSIKKNIPNEMMSFSAFIVKTAYEGKISLKVKTHYGDPSLSISPNNAILNWTKDF